LLESFTDKVAVLARRLVSFPIKIPTFASVNIRDSSRGATSGPLHLLGKIVRYLGWFLSRVIYQLKLLPTTLGRGIRYWLSTKAVSRQFWTVLATFTKRAGKFGFLMALLGKTAVMRQRLKK